MKLGVGLLDQVTKREVELVQNIFFFLFGRKRMDSELNKTINCNIAYSYFRS
jgi:hypothetical protein